MATYRVLMDDSFNFTGKGGRAEHGRFETAAEAIAAGRKLVDAALAKLHRPGMSADELLEQYFSLGHDPVVETPPDLAPVNFSAWDYAAARAAAICTEIEA